MENCTNCQKEIHKLEVFPKGLCVDCHAQITPMATAQELIQMWRGF